MSTKIKIRRDIKSNWESINPILDDGELALIKDTGKIKIGNGVDNFNSLGNINSPVNRFLIDKKVVYNSSINDFLIDDEKISKCDEIELFCYFNDNSETKNDLKRVYLKTQDNDYVYNGYQESFKGANVDMTLSKYNLPYSIFCRFETNIMVYSKISKVFNTNNLFVNTQGYRTSSGLYGGVHSSANWLISSSLDKLIFSVKKDEDDSIIPITVFDIVIIGNIY